MDNNKKTLAERILDGDTNNLQEMVNSASYSQPLQRLAAVAGIDNHHSILKYNGQESEGTFDDIESEEIIDIHPVISKKKTPKSPQKPKAKKNSKRRKASKRISGHSEFSSWLTNQIPLPGAEILVKNSKKKKKRKKKTKTVLDKNIQGSVREKEEIASEALAKLYAAQGHHKKALKMYEKLSLINPQKSGFFAPLIENLKNKLQ